MELSEREVLIAAAILDSYRDRAGEDLIDRTGDAHSDAVALRNAPFVVLSHDGAVDPVFVYANESAATRWVTTVDVLVGMPSRLSASPEHRDERAGALAQAMRGGIYRGYAGERMGLDGSRFMIEGAVLWTVNGLPEGPGQAATFTWSV